MKLLAKDGKCAEETDWVKTVCLPPPLQGLQPGATCEIAGYGKEKFGEESLTNIMTLSEQSLKNKYFHLFYLKN